MIKFRRVFFTDIVHCSENAAPIFQGEDTYNNFTKEWEKHHEGYTLYTQEDGVIGVVTVAKEDDGCDVVAIFTPLIHKYPISFVRTMKHLLTLAQSLHKCYKLTFLIKAGFVDTDKYAKTLGFVYRDENIFEDADGNKYICYWRE